MAKSAASPAEEALWKRLEGSQIGVPFSLHARVLGYDAQFYCPSAKLVVELEATEAERKSGAHPSLKGRGQKWRGLVLLRLSADMTPDAMIERIDRKLTFLQVERQPAPGDRGQETAGQAA